LHCINIYGHWKSSETSNTKFTNVEVVLK
jgi:hypothetical protein